MKPKHRVFSLNVVIVFALILTVVPFRRAVAGTAATFTVNSRNDPGNGTCDATECTLREAITAANATAGTDTIVFDIPCLDLPLPIIAPQSPLPIITHPVVIDGTNLDGACPLDIGLTGLNAGAGANGLRISAGDSTVRNFLYISDFEGAGILLEGNDDNLVEENAITNNGGAGIAVLSGSGHRLRENYIYDNGGLGIDLGNDGPTDNDEGDGDGGPNGRQNYPLIQSTTKTAANTTVAGTLRSAPNTQFALEFFSNLTCDDSGYGEGRAPEGTLTVTTDGQGHANFSFVGDAQARNFTVTATDAAGSTSEFSPCKPDLVVNSTADRADQVQGDGVCNTGQEVRPGEPECTLRAAIQEANFTTAKDAIAFDISAAGTPVIRPDGPLSQVAHPLDLDATTQPDGGKVQLDGSNAGGSADGLTLNADDGSVRGFIVTRFGGDGLVVNNVADNLVQGNVITGNLGVGLALNGAGAQSNQVRDNVVTNNQTNLSVAGSGNTIVNNVFNVGAATQQNATFAAGANTLHQPKTAGTNIVDGPYLGGNYWSDYTGPDADGDYLGDEPHTLNANNVDQLPLVGFPDLTVREWTLQSTDLVFQDNKFIFPLDITVQNIDLGTAVNAVVRFTDNGGLDTTQTIPLLAPGASAQLHLDWDVTALLSQGEGQAQVQLAVAVDPDNVIGERDETNNSDSASVSLDVRPRIEDIEYDYFLGWFLAGVHLGNEFQVTVDWNGDMTGAGETDLAQEVIFQLAAQETREPANHQTAVSHEFDMGCDLIAGKNTLDIQARNAADFDSESSLFQIRQTAVPAWVVFIPGVQSEFDVERIYKSGPNNDEVIYRTVFKFPSEIVRAAVGAGAQAGPVAGRFGPTIPAWELRVESHSNGRGRIIGTAGLMAEAKNSPFQGGIGGGVQGTVQVDPQEKLRLVDLLAIIYGYGKLRAPKWPLVGPIYLQITGELRVEGRLGVEEDRATGQAKFKPAIILRLEPGVEAAIGTGEKGLAWAEAAFGGKVRGEFQFFESPYCRSAFIRAYARLSAGVLWFEKTQKWTWRWVLVGSQSVQGEEPQWVLVGWPEPLGASEWQLADRDYVSPGYATFVGDTAALLGQSTILSDTYPYADPAAAYLGGGETLALWVHDDPGKPQQQALELYSSAWDGAAWSTPISLTNDLIMDQQPTLAATPDGAFAAWTRLRNEVTGTLPISPTQLYDEMEIAYASYDAAGDTWSAPQRLTDNGVMDFLPAARSHLSQTMLLWLRDPDNDFPTFPDDTVPLGEDVYYAVRDGTTWAISSTQALTDVSTAEQPQFAYDGQRAVLAWSQDLDRDPSTITDTEILYATWTVTDTTWSSPQPLTDDGLADHSPRLAYDSAGIAHLLWAQQVPDPDNPDDRWSNLYHATFDGGAWSAPTLVLEEPGIEGLLLLSDEGDNLVALWRAVSDEVSDLYRTVYDFQDGSWSQARPLTQDRDMEWAYDAVYDDLNDQVFLVMMERQVITEVVSVDFPTAASSFGSPYSVSAAPLTETVPITMPAFGASNLVQLVHTPASDLVITSTNIALTPVNPSPGSSALISATVENQGDLAASPIKVAFYDGDPGAGGTLIGTPALAGSLPGGLTTTLSVDWTVPVTPAVHTLYVRVDPLDEVAERDEGNNQATLAAILPDLTVAYGYAIYSEGQGMTLTAHISNTGVYTATGVQVAFRRQAITGTLLGQSTLTSLPPGQAGTVDVVWDISSTVPITPLVWVLVDPGDAVLEVDEENNLGFLWADILPDLALTATDIAGSGPITVSVHNAGFVTTTDVRVVMYQDTITGTPFYSGTIGAIGPHASGSLALSVAAGDYDLFVEADPDNAIPEMDESNNLAVRAMAISFQIYLPLVLRAWP